MLFRSFNNLYGQTNPMQQNQGNQPTQNPPFPTMPMMPNYNPFMKGFNNPNLVTFGQNLQQQNQAVPTNNSSTSTIVPI